MDLRTQPHLRALRQALQFRLAESRIEIHVAELSRRTPLDAIDPRVGSASR